MKKLILFILLTTLFQRIASAQQNVNPESTIDDPASQHDEVMPEFPGGFDSLMKYLKENIVYPKLALENKIEGLVEVTFTIDIDGSISNIKVRKSLGFGCDEEAMRVIRRMPRWKPGMINGKPVRVAYMIPVKFTYDKSKKKKKNS